MDHKSSVSVLSFNFLSAIGFHSVMGCEVSTSQMLPPFHPLKSPVPSNVTPEAVISSCTSPFCFSEIWISELCAARHQHLSRIFDEIVSDLLQQTDMRIKISLDPSFSSTSFIFGSDSIRITGTIGSFHGLPPSQLRQTLKTSLVASKKQSFGKCGAYLE